jgi:hypothetical protein
LAKISNQKAEKASGSQNMTSETCSKYPYLHSWPLQALGVIARRMAVIGNRLATLPAFVTAA